MINIYKLIIVILFTTLSIFANDNIKISYYLTEKNLSIDEIKNIDKFKISNGENFGFSDKYCFLKIEAVNSTSEKIKKYFQFEYPYIDHIWVYKDNFKAKKYGQLEKFNREFLSLQNVAFYVNVAPKSKNITYVKIKSTLPLKTNIKIFNEDEYFKNIIFQKQLFAFVYGIIIVMIIYNLIIYFNLKEKSYLYYVLFHSVGVFGIFAFSGLGFEYIWAEYPMVNYHTYGVVVNLLSIFDYLLIIYFLDTQKYLPKITKLLRIFINISLLLTISSLFFVVNNLYELNMIFTELVVFFVMVYMIVKYKIGIAKYILIAKLFLFFGVIVLTLSEFGIITDSFIVDNAYILGIVIELILMSFVLSYKYKDEKFRHKLEKQKRIQTEQMLITKHKLSVLGEMFNNVVHQWRQPLSQINSIIFNIESEYNLNKLNRDVLEDRLNSIENLTHYLSQSIDDFKNFSKEQKLSHFSVKSLIEKTLSVTKFLFTSNSIKIEVNYKNRDIYLFSNKNELVQLLIIILDNAKDALLKSRVQNPKVIIDISSDEYKNYIKISNNGDGIHDEVLDKIFEPNFTTKESNGMGIGLYIAKNIITKLKGEIDVISSKEWVSFIVKIPKNM